MNTLRLTLDHPLASAFVFLLLGSFFTTLRAAFQYTGEAGVTRLAERFQDSAERIQYWQPRWSLMVISLQLLSLFGRICFIALLFFGFLETLNHTPLQALVFLFPAILLVWLSCMLVPQATADAFADLITIRFLPFVGLLTRLLTPLCVPLSWLQHMLKRRMLAGSAEESRPSPEDEIRSLVDQAHALDMEEEEREMIRSIFEFGDTVAREIMTPRVDVIGLEQNSLVLEAIHEVSATSFSRFPVYSRTMDEVVGMIHIRDLLKQMAQNGEKNTLAQIAKPVAFVPESMPIQDLLALMQQQHHHLAMVVDEYGGTAGVITMEDIIEEIVGEIHDEYDVKRLAIQPLTDHTYLIDARIDIDEINDRLDIEIPDSEEYDSLAGYILHELGHIPESGEKVEREDFRLTVRSATAQQILSVQLERLLSDPDTSR